MLRNRKLWGTMAVVAVVAMVLSACAPTATPEPGPKVEVTRLVEVTREVPAAEKKLKAGFIYVGPIGDYGWSHAHDQGRLYVENQFPWLETVYAEAVPEAMDETAQGQWLGFVSKQGMRFVEASIKTLYNAGFSVTRLEEEKGGRVYITLHRPRPVQPDAEKE